MSQKPQKEQCGSGCGTVSTERNRYFTGKYMTARDFAGEQDYFLNRQRLHNRLHHGWGIVCGLRILHHPRSDQEECKERWLVVKAGVAIDCCGREVFVPEDTPIEVPLNRLPPWEEGEEEEPHPGEPPPEGEDEDDHDYEDDEHDDKDEDEDEDHEEEGSSGYVKSKRMAKLSYDDYPGGKGRGKRRGHRDRRGKPHHGRRHDRDHHHHHDHDDDPYPGIDWPENGLLLCLHYDEEEIEPVPVLYAEGHCDPQHHEANRIREVARFSFKRLDEVDPGCWRMPNGWDGSEPCQNDCDEPLPGPSGGCIEPECPCKDCIPLALLTANDITAGGGESTSEPLFDIDMRGRRHLLPPPHYLTHIIGTNWPHGGEVTLHELREHMNGELKIYFDRKIMPQVDDSTGTGINRRTFTAEYGGIQRGLEFLPCREHNEPQLEENGCVATFPIAPPFLRGRDNIADNFVYVTLRCDFILDCHEMPIDGDHLRGRLPSGNGIPGGEFVSWFRVVHDHHHHDEENE